MEILSIVYSTASMNKQSFVSHLLKMNTPNDYVFENNYFQIQMKSTDYACLLYRIMWETMYLRRKDERTISRLTGDTMYLMMSISETIGFLHQALPPALKKNIGYELTSTDIIRNKLCEILIESNDNMINYYLSHFWQVMRFQEFENPWNFNLSKINKLRTMNEKTLTCQIVHSTGKIEQMLDPTPDDDQLIHNTVLVFATKQHDDLSKLLNVVYLKLRILSIKIEKGVFYIMAYSPYHDVHDRTPNSINQWIYDSYHKIVK